MSEPTVIPAPADRYRHFRFRVLWGGRPVAGFREISGRPVKAKGSAPWQRGSPRPSIGPEGQGTQFFASLGHGVSFDLAFEQWVAMARCYGPATGKGSLCREYVRPITIEERDPDGKVVSLYHLARCWVTGYRAVPGPDAGASEMSIGYLKLGFESWEREPPVDSEREPGAPVPGLERKGIKIP